MQKLYILTVSLKYKDTSTLLQVLGSPVNCKGKVKWLTIASATRACGFKETESSSASLRPDYNHIKAAGFPCPGRDSCLGYYETANGTAAGTSAGKGGRGSTGPGWLRRNCFCDDLCAMYGDCCIDARAYNKQEQATNFLNFGCVHLRHFGDLYMRHKVWPLTHFFLFPFL